MFSSMFCFRPGRVKLLEPTSACDPDDVELAVRGVRLGMELVAVVDPCFDLARGESLDNRRSTFEKWVVDLVCVEALLECAFCSALYGLEHGLLRTERELVAHQNSDLLQLLPSIVELEQRADLEEACRYVKRSSKLTPLA